MIASHVTASKEYHELHSFMHAAQLGRRTNNVNNVKKEERMTPFNDESIGWSDRHRGMGAVDTDM
jgi:hypothetical protein